ncbi:ribosome small subunit-dependent GTPase A [Intestinimonas butyriciproducens]|uniref:ribosome small subunit-dependent GTPase A n=1 Tax=Intestinimonas butyriciproducens TaxID=1297617 RepID=UPI00195C42D7|nr:ribosome small subunit-dependent GTPase A [Intestinimonas butyriciproducens]MBM6974813.1 ribosome small subunit-dependent GTPase A [Intestinimonas butyriciproducens]
MTEGIGMIRKALSGFYYVDDGSGELVSCRARGKFRHKKITPLVGDRVKFTRLSDGSGALDEILPRKNQFQRPAVANIDQLVIIVSGAIPVTEPFLIDRVTAIADSKEHCDCLICINKCDLEPGDELYKIYTAAGFPTIRVSATTGEGIDTLRAAISEKVSAFTGNSGVGKSSILNALSPSFHLQVGEVSEKLGRGRHTTRHVELYRLETDAVVADTPGFSSFDTERMELLRKEELELAFREFRPYLGACQFVGCSHVKEKGCAILAALREGKIMPSRHASYIRLWEQVKDLREWELEKHRKG